VLLRELAQSLASSLRGLINRCFSQTLLAMILRSRSVKSISCSTVAGFGLLWNKFEKKSDKADGLVVIATIFLLRYSPLLQYNFGSVSLDVDGASEYLSSSPWTY
jgi:hypothetical protein